MGGGGPNQVRGVGKKIETLICGGGVEDVYLALENSNFGNF